MRIFKFNSFLWENYNIITNVIAPKPNRKPSHVSYEMRPPTGHPQRHRMRSFDLEDKEEVIWFKPGWPGWLFLSQLPHFWLFFVAVGLIFFELACWLFSGFFFDNRIFMCIFYIYSLLTLTILNFFSTILKNFSKFSITFSQWNEKVLLG